MKIIWQVSLRCRVYLYLRLSVLELKKQSHTFKKLALICNFGSNSLMKWMFYLFTSMIYTTKSWFANLNHRLSLLVVAGTGMSHYVLLMSSHIFTCCPHPPLHAPFKMKLNTFVYHEQILNVLTNSEIATY